ncbi:radical SAM protein with 4Fe4S-binding SPASM domain [Porphyromonas loveana]|uniref:Radical SAM protein with 4Fe4S-binding SPASM domain n=2 Tax=Porphyromonas loveana TaxID=1884669 RepID=A0A2U1FL20_9PORP|nr:radical SAM protein with 4Fe4S-binding SPASM domain [Porphyromonas loveana]
MEKEDPIKIIKKHIKKDAKYILINFFGGEPTLEIDTIRNTVEYLKTIQDKKIYLRISTNGCTSEETLDYLIENRFHITISSDGIADKNSTLDKIRKADIVEKALLYLAKRNAIFTVRYTATSSNYKNMSEAIKYWRSIGVPLAHIEPYHPTGNSKEEKSLLPDVNDYVSSFLEAVNEAETSNLLITTGAYMNLLTPSSYFCTGASGQFCVYNPDGSITTCYRVQSFDSPYKEFIIGNWKTNNTTSIWTTNKTKLNQHSIIQMSPCHGCKNKYLCSGGCLMRNLTQTGSLNTADNWLCKMKHLLLKDATARIWNNLSKGTIPVILGRFIFEDFLARTPSLPLEEHSPIIKNKKIMINQKNGVFDIFDCIGIDRKDEYTIFNKKIARTECL